jgi:hypothetical protein
MGAPAAKRGTSVLAKRFAIATCAGESTGNICASRKLAMASS